MFSNTDFVGIVASAFSPTSASFRVFGNSTAAMTVRDSSRFTTQWFAKDTYDDLWRVRKSVVGLVGSESETQYSALSWGGYTGTWTIAANAYTTQVGATFYGSFIGDTLYLISYTDDRGGIWRFTFDGDAENYSDVSVWSSAAVATANTLVKTGLRYGTHTFVATFIGSDPLHAPTGGTPRGWAKQTSTIRGAYRMLSGTEALMDTSNKEFAISMKRTDDASGLEFFPEHNNIGTAFQTTAPLAFVDGSEISLSVSAEYDVLSSFLLEQEFKATVHTFDLALSSLSIEMFAGGVVDVSFTHEFTADCNVGAGYIAMLPMDGAGARFVTNTPSNYDATTWVSGGQIYTPIPQDGYCNGACVVLSLIHI